jgi:Family of unknown function (DUF6282)
MEATAEFHPELDADRTTPDPVVDELLMGAVDMHTHPSPSPFPRRISILDAARDAASAGFRAIVCKSHHESTQPMILALQSAGLADVDIDVLGGIALNRAVGGFNPYAVELTLKSGGRVVWFPTLSSVAHVNHEHSADSTFTNAAMQLRPDEPQSILDEEGEVRSDVRDVVQVIADQDAVLNCGHLGADEIDVLIPIAREAGVQRIVVSHPSFVVGATPERTKGWVEQGAKIEQCIAVARRRMSDGELDAYIDAVGVSNTIISSDFGQKKNPLPVTGFRRIARQLLDSGRSEDDVRQMVAVNATELLGLGS